MTHSFAPYLKHFGKTPEEQLEKNQPFKKWLEQKLKEEVSEEEAQANHEFLQRLKATIDSFRPEGHKLFSNQ